MADIELRDYQREAIAAVRAAEQRGQRRNVVVLATGLGKTIIFSALTAATPGRTLILAHRDELITQAVDKLLMVAPELALSVGVVKAERNDPGGRVVVASVQTLAQERRRVGLGAFERVIVDEAHHAAAATYRAILEDVGVFAQRGPTLLGVTATPVRGDSVGLSDIFEGIVYERDIQWGIGNGYLCDLRGVRVELDFDLDAVRSSAGDWADGALSQAMEQANAPEHVAIAYQKHAPGRRAIVFTPTVDLASQAQEALTFAGVRAEVVYGAMRSDERKAVLARFHSGETQVVCNCAVLTEGFDEPAVDCIIIARPTKSGALYQQMVGRGTRRNHPGKTDCVVIDLVGVTARHSLVTLNTLFGLPLDALQNGKKTVSEAMMEAEEQAAAAEVNRLRAQAVDLFGRRASFHWTQTGPLWVISSAGGQYALEPVEANQETDAWRLVSLKAGQQRQVVIERAPLAVGMGRAEDLVRNEGAGLLAAKNAPWRSGPASDKQKEALRRFRIPVPEGLTKGKANELLNEAIAAKTK